MTRSPNTTQKSRTRRSERGTVLIFAIGALAIISVIAVSYVSVVRIERNSAAAVTNQSGRTASVDIVVDRIRDVVAADLFGNKVVTNSTPKTIGSGNNAVRVWPRMFEDGEFYDYPSVDELDLGPRNATSPNSTFDTRFLNDPNSTFNESRTGDNWVLDVEPAVGTTIGRRFATANPDDAWLATTEPEYHDPTDDFLGSNPNPIAWRNITNLRSTYRFVRRERGEEIRNSEGIGLWVRGDGRFADLAEFFNDADNNANDVPPSNMFGDAGRDISVIDPEYGSVHHDGSGVLNTGGLGVNERARTSVYQFQMNLLDDDIDFLPDVRAGMIVPRSASTPDPSDVVWDAKDERFWTDTDGDLRPDARWQVLDELGNLANLRWVVATRIIDASSLVNVNTSISFDNNVPGTEPGIGAGRTPADIDLFRLLDRSGDTGGTTYYTNPNVRTSDLDGSWAQHHLPEGLGLIEFDGSNSVYEELTDTSSGSARVLNLPYVDNLLDVGPSAVALPNRELRSAYYEFVGSSPVQTDLDNAVTYAPRELVDLMAFWGTNDATTVTNLEQNMDGPDGDPYYPTSSEDYNDAGPLGPMRSRENPLDARVLSDGVALSDARPTVENLRRSVRNAITTISGVGNYSPVPVLNDDPAFANTYFREKINLRDLERIANDRTSGRSALRGEHVFPVFEAFTWALAPFATDQPYSSDLAAGNITGDNTTVFSSVDAHYGGFDTMTANSLAGRILEGSTADEGPGFALRTAASLTANLIDAMDDDPSGMDEPTILRILRRAQADNKIIHNSQQAYGDSDLTLAIEMGLNFAHGEVNPDLIQDASNSMGNALDYSGPGAQFNNIPAVDPDIATENGANVNADELDLTGLTVVGLERQPFLVQSSVYSFYENDAAVLPQGTVNTADTFQNQAYVMFFELYNPWPEAIDVNVGDRDYWLVIPQNTTTIGQFDPANPTTTNDLRFALPPIGGWAPGDSLIFYWAWPFDSGAMNLPESGVDGLEDIEDSAPAIVEQLYQKLIGETDSAMQGVGVFPRRLLPPDEAFGTLNETATGQVWSRTDELNANFTGEHPVLLTRRMQSAASTNQGTDGEAVWNGASGPPSQFYEVVVDKMVPATGQRFPGDGLAYDVASTGVAVAHNIPTVNDYVTEYFEKPREDGGAGYTIVTDLDVNNDMIVQVGVHLLTIRTLSRDKGGQGQSSTGSPSGWPTGILEPATGLMVQEFDHRTFLPADPMSIGALFTPLAALELKTDSTFIPASATGIPSVSPELFLLNSNFGDDGLGSSAFDPDQYNVPDTAQTLSLAMTGTADPEFRPYQMHVPNGPLNSVGEIGMISQFAHICLNHDIRNVEEWDTVSEQMHRARTRPGQTALTVPDPYMGVLDPTLNLYGGSLTDPGFVGGLGGTPPDYAPENLTVPLATRVYDCFEALEPISSLKQGVINVNTASARVLEMLPFVEPRSGYPSGGPTIMGIDTTRANVLVEYRDRIESLDGSGNGLLVDFKDPSMLNLGAGLRNTSRPGAGGISTIGEIGIMDVWDPATGDPAMSSTLFTELGADMSQGAVAGNPTFLDLTPHSLIDLDPVDDPEERGRIFQGISNLATTRSDLFLAWFVVRGYDPDEIERITVPGAGEDALVNTNDPANPFRPAFERRYLIVLDRSNMQDPTDRPEVLLRFRLPDLN